MVAVQARSLGDTPPKGNLKQLVVRVHKSSKGLEFDMSPYTLKKGDANYWLAEVKLRECSDCQVIPIIDDDVELNAITQISEMAVNAGFKDIRPFVLWRKTGRMAEIQFGPAIKFTTDSKKIEGSSEKAQ
jgi:hypothetical protein